MDSVGEGEGGEIWEEAKDMVRKMTPGGEMATRREGTADPHHDLMKTSSSGGPPTKSLQNSHSR